MPTPNRVIPEVGTTLLCQAPAPPVARDDDGNTSDAFTPRQKQSEIIGLVLGACVALTLLLTSTAGATSGPEPASEFELQLRSGLVLAGKVQSITSHGVQLAEREVAWSELRSLRQQGVIFRRPVAGAVWLGRCDVLYGPIEKLTSEEICIQRHPLAESTTAHPITIPTEFATACILRLPHSEAARRDQFLSVSRPHQKADEAWLVSGDRFTGEFQSMTGGTVLWNFPTGEPTRFPRRDLQLIRFNPDLVSVPALPKQTWRVALSDGSLLTIVDWGANEAVNATPDQQIPPNIVLRLAGGPEITTSRADLHRIVFVDDGDRPLGRDDVSAIRWQSDLGGKYEVSVPSEMSNLPVDVVTSVLTPVGTTPLVSHSAEPLVISQRGNSALQCVVQSADHTFEAQPALDDVSSRSVIAEVHIDGKVVAEWTLSAESPIGRMVSIPLRGHNHLELHVRRSPETENPPGQVIVNWLDPIVRR